jgi:hypothetical protein
VASHNVNLGSYNGSTYNSASNLNIICGIETGCPTNSNPQNVNNNLFFVNTQPLCTYDAGALCDVNGVGSGIGSFDTPEQDFYRPFPFYQNIYQLKHDFYSNYNSAQIQWNKSAGFVSFGANYTFAKNLATASAYNNVIVDPVHLRNDYNAVPYDRTQVFNAHYLIDEGRRYKGGNRILSEAANNWQISGISTVQSGFPLASEQGENFGFGYGSTLPVQVAYPNQTDPQNAGNCASTYGIQPAPPSAPNPGSTYCVQGMNPTVWAGNAGYSVDANSGGQPGRRASRSSVRQPAGLWPAAPWNQWRLSAPVHSRAVLR